MKPPATTTEDWKTSPRICTGCRSRISGPKSGRQQDQDRGRDQRPSRKAASRPLGHASPGGAPHRRSAAQPKAAPKAQRSPARLPSPAARARQEGQRAARKGQRKTGSLGRRDPLIQAEMRHDREPDRHRIQDHRRAPDGRQVKRQKQKQEFGGKERADQQPLHRVPPVRAVAGDRARPARPRRSRPQGPSAARQRTPAASPSFTSFDDDLVERQNRPWTPRSIATSAKAVKFVFAHAGLPPPSSLLH